MEKTPAACAMDWSIQLDKGLRSHNPGKRIEAIQEVGARLEWWNKEPELSVAEYDMIGLVPGEDKLFANAILLRLADTFMAGDKPTKLCVVKIFLSELKSRKMKRSSRKNKGILSRYKIENHLELLRRIKLCFNSGDEEVRSLALVLFGCWSDFANDNAEIRYLILSSVVSCHVLEVKASLFAAGCFCEFSNDFGCVLLEILVNMVSSSDMPLANKLAGGRAFAKIRSSSALASRAYEEGLKLILGCDEDDLVITMLISLSKIASTSALLISRQVALLLSFLSQNKALPLQATSLRCLSFILSRRPFHFSATTELISAMFSMLNGEIPPAMQCDVMHILYKILMSKILSFSCSEMHECFTKLLTVVEIVMQSPLISNRLFVIRVLSDISGKFTTRTDDKTLASQAISFIIARITLLANSILNLHQSDMEMKQEIWSLFKLLLIPLNECPNLGEFALSKLYYFINCGVLVQFGNDHRTFVSRLVVRVSKVVVFCLKNLEKAGSLNSQVQNIVRLLIEDVCGCNYFDYYVHTVYSLLLHPQIEELIIKSEMLGLENAKKLLEVKDNWSAYNAGKYAVFQGAWSTAAFIFGELIKTVHSDSCHQWLTSLALFSYSEMKIKYCCFSNERSLLLNWLNSNRSSALPIVGDLGETGKTIKNLDGVGDVFENFDGVCENIGNVNGVSEIIENLDGVCKILRSSLEMLFATDVTPSCQHYFQIRFLSLRANVIEIGVHIFKLLGTVSFQEHNVTSKELKGSSILHAASLVHPLTQLSTRLIKLAQEYDLLATSFIGMDGTNIMIISSHALSCLILAFITGFSLYFANLGSQKLEGNFYSMLIQDLIVRLWHIDPETSKELLLLLKTCFGESKSCYVSRSKAQRLENTYEVRSIIKICRFAVKGVIGLQNAAKRMNENDDEVLLQITNDGLVLQLDTMRKWLNVSLKTPTYFFHVRPCVSCQLFSMNRDSGNSEKISVLTGYHLHLDLCLQLTRVSPESMAWISKLYCILQCKSNYKTPTHSEFKDLGDDSALELNEKLVKYVTNCDKDDNTFNGQIAETIVCFRPNGKGQGFSTCLLDVSMFPLGSYVIQWRAGCVDINGCYWTLPSLNSGPVFTVKSCLKG